MVQPILLFDGILFLVLGVLMYFFAEPMMKFQAYTNKKLFDIKMTYTKKTIKIMRWFPGGFFVILGIFMFIMSFFAN